MSKECTKCKQIKPFGDFGKRRDVPCGLTSWCTKCRVAHNRTKRVEKSQYDRKYRAERREKINAKQREGYAANRDERKRKSAAWRAKNKDRIKDSHAERMLVVRARAKRMFNTAKRTCDNRGLSFNITSEDVEQLLNIGRCMKSGLKIDMGPNNGKTNPFGPSLDRIDNARGYEKDNIQIVCFMFNAGKNHNLELDFLAMCSAVHMMQGYRPDVIARMKELI